MADPSLLIVEDDRAAIEIIGFVLAKRFPRSDLKFAYDGEMGIEVFKEQLPDIVVTDINMPKMDGIRMAEEIKAISPATRFVVLTAYSDRIHLERFREIGISHHVMKPVQFEKLFDALDQVMGEIQAECR